MAVEVVATRRRFTRAEYQRMGEVGILRQDDRVELIRGEVFEMPPPGRRHRAFVGNINQMLVVRLSGRAVVWMQNPIVLTEDSEPVPDISVLRQRAVSYKEREADAADVFVLIEVADTSLTYDRSTKARLYAEAGVPEYWVVDCTAESVEVYRTPGPEGYRDIRLVAGRATLTLQAFPDVELTTAQIFA